uniref:Uncharacterized protein n=1 Tax=Caenorhabditis japonica TaxID=281687 RepID=A0A8R1DPI3_CAEJA
MCLLELIFGLMTAKKKQIVHRILDILDISEKAHTGLVIAHELTKVVEKYELWGKLAALVRDGGSNVKLAGKLLGINHFDCFNHRLYLAVTAGIEELNGRRNIVIKLKRIAKRLKKSNLAKKELQHLQNLLENPVLNLKTAIDIRWSSVFDMLQRAVDCKQSLILFLSNKTEFPQLDSVEWETITVLLKILKPIKKVCDNTQARGNTCSIVIPTLTILLEKLHERQDYPAVREAICRRLQDFLNTYKENSFLIVFIVLDV